MRIDRRFLGWGVFFLAAGAVPLAVQAGAVSGDVAGQVWRLWPVILIGLGAAIVLGRSGLGWIGGLLVAATFGLLVGSALGGGFGRTGCGFDANGANPSGGAEVTTGGELADGATVELDFDCGPLTVAAAPGSAWSLAYRQDQVPQVDAAPQRVRVRTPEGSFLGRGAEWRVTLPAERTLALDVVANAASTELTLANARLARLDGTFNAGSFGLDLSGSTIGGLDLRLNAGSGSLTLPAATFSGRLDVNAASLDVCAPAGAGLRITTSGALSSTDFTSSGLVLTGSTWESPGYASAATKIDLTLSANAANVTLRRDGGCS